ncbi:MAG: hypothetical protein ACLRPU_00450 [Enterococcus hulanensis]
MNQLKIKEFFLSFKNSNKIYRYLFSLACLTCISIGWTSAKYTSEIYASSDSARSAKFSYEIDNEVQKVDKDGNLKAPLSPNLHEWADGGMNKYEINTISGNDKIVQEKVKVIFTIKIQPETAVKFTMKKDISETDRPLKVETAQLTGSDGVNITVNDPATNDLLSHIIYPSTTEQTYTCTVLLYHDGRAVYISAINPDTGQPYGYLSDKYINLVPTFEQVD